MGVYRHHATKPNQSHHQQSSPPSILSEPLSGTLVLRSDPDYPMGGQQPRLPCWWTCCSVGFPTYRKPYVVPTKPQDVVVQFTLYHNLLWFYPSDYANTVPELSLNLSTTHNTFPRLTGWAYNVVRALKPYFTSSRISGSSCPILCDSRTCDIVYTTKLD